MKGGGRRTRRGRTRSEQEDDEEEVMEEERGGGREGPATSTLSWCSCNKTTGGLSTNDGTHYIFKRTLHENPLTPKGLIMCLGSTHSDIIITLEVSEFPASPECKEQKSRVTMAFGAFKNAPNAPNAIVTRDFCCTEDSFDAALDALIML